MSNSAAQGAQGDLYRMVSFVQFSTALSLTGGESQESNDEYARNQRWTNGFIVGPWVSEEDQTKNATISARSGRNEEPKKDIPPDQLFLSTLFWCLLFITVVIVGVLLVLAAVRWAWRRFKRVHQKIDVKKFNDTPLVPVAALTRMAMLGLNGLTIATVFQLVEFNSGAPSFGLAMIFFFLYVLGLPILNYLVLHKARDTNPNVSQSVKEKLRTAFSPMFGTMRPEYYLGTFYFVLKRCAVAAVIGGMRAYPVGQATFIWGLNSCYLTWLIASRPYIDARDNTVSIPRPLDARIWSFVTLWYECIVCVAVPNLYGDDGNRASLVLVLL